MVLEDASTPPPTSESASGFTPDSTPSSDLDPYAGSNPEYLEGRPSSYVRVNNSSNAPIYVNIADLPKPYGTDSSRWIPVYETLLSRNVHDASVVLQRPVTQSEADAFASHIGSSLLKQSYGPPIGLALGLLQFARGMRTFRFPFYTPFKQGSKFSPDRLLFTLRGAPARAGWQVLRLVAYSWVGSEFGRTAGAVYALSSESKERRNDSRLKDYHEAVKNQTPEMRRKVMEGWQKANREREQNRRSEQRGESAEMGRMRRQAASEQARQRHASSAAAVDDMSPTGGAFAEETRTQSDGFVSDDWQSPQEAQPWQNSTMPSTNSNTQQSTNTPQSTSNPQRPTSPSTQQQSSSSNKQSGSAWDRLRKDAMSSGQSKSSNSSSSSHTSRPSQQSSSSSSAGDSFSFSEGEEDKQLAKSEAQKEFDARIEREREGKNFDDASRGGRRW